MHFFQWYLKVRKPEPVQLPAEEESVTPTAGMPVEPKTITRGGTTFLRSRPAITTVGSDVAEVEPLVPVAVTRTRRREPTSAATATYDDPVAPKMSAQKSPSESQ